MKGPDSSLAHYDHRFLGQVVIDGNGRRGVLRGVAPDLLSKKGPVDIGMTGERNRSDAEAMPPVAWLAPEGGGAEWTAPLRSIYRAPRST